MLPPGAVLAAGAVLAGLGPAVGADVAAALQAATVRAVAAKTRGNTCSSMA
jgi:hypothetical protein